VIKGAQQSIEYGNNSVPIHHITVDLDGRERWPSAYPTVEIFNPDGTQLVAPATVNAELDMVAAGCAAFDTVIQVRSAGDWGNEWTIQTAPAVSLSVAIDRFNKTVLIEYVDGATTVTQIEARIATVAATKDIDVIEVKTAGTGANVLNDPADTIAATSMAGGVGAAMIPKIAKFEGLLDYNTQTAEFENGEILTGGTSGATGVIRGQEVEGASGTLHLGRVDGLFSTTTYETITDSGSGSAKTNGGVYSCHHFYNVDASATGTWPIAQNYHARILYYIDGLLYKYDLYFDVSYAPMCRPFVTSHDIEEMHPTWGQFLPKDWQDWRNAIQNGHSDLVRRIHKYGDQAADFVKRESEWWGIEIAFIERWIAIHCGFEKEERKYWEDNAESEWTHRGRVTVQKDDDADIEEDKQNLPRSGTVR
jgi:hypothetical protein